MPATNKRIDDYMANSAAFAKPILQHLRNIIHEACPDITETIKWSFPHFEYKGSILCSMASFQQHCSFGFWLASLMNDADKILTIHERTAMGHLGQIKSVNDLPSNAVLKRYIKQAMQLIESGAKLPKKPATADIAAIITPDYFIAALAKNKKAKEKFESFPYSHKKEYVMWITEAKTEVTRQKKADTAIERIAAGKGRNWKYEKATNRLF